MHAIHKYDLYDSLYIFSGLYCLHHVQIDPEIWVIILANSGLGHGPFNVSTENRLRQACTHIHIYIYAAVIGYP